MGTSGWLAVVNAGLIVMLSSLVDQEEGSKECIKDKRLISASSR
jgi:hypothetical protein